MNTEIRFTSVKTSPDEKWIFTEIENETAVQNLGWIADLPLTLLHSRHDLRLPWKS